MKVTVRIHKPTGLEFRTKKIDEDGRVTLRKRKKNQTEWRPKITGMEIKQQRFGRVKYYTDVFQDSPETFQINARDKTIERPELEQKEVLRIAKMKVFEKRYASEPKMLSPSLLYIILLIQIMSIIITFLLVTGRLRL